MHHPVQHPMRREQRLPQRVVEGEEFAEPESGMGEADVRLQQKRPEAEQQLVLLRLPLVNNHAEPELLRRISPVLAQRVRRALAPLQRNRLLSCDPLCSPRFVVGICEHVGLVQESVLGDDDVDRDAGLELLAGGVQGSVRAAAGPDGEVEQGVKSLDLDLVGRLVELALRYLEELRVVVAAVEEVETLQGPQLCKEALLLQQDVQQPPAGVAVGLIHLLLLQPRRRLVAERPSDGRWRGGGRRLLLACLSLSFCHCVGGRRSGGLCAVSSQHSVLLAVQEFPPRLLERVEAANVHARREGLLHHYLVARDEEENVLLQHFELPNPLLRRRPPEAVLHLLLCRYPPANHKLAVRVLQQLSCVDPLLQHPHVRLAGRVQ
mmetsp:Transcript_15506/g.60645  ORF Transcript_15506/g.60645 Transcript_15506/m.60645 type:complete len:378 (-) Transcript_15506:842-1975(-)